MFASSVIPAVGEAVAHDLPGVDSFGEHRERCVEVDGLGQQSHLHPAQGLFERAVPGGHGHVDRLLVETYRSRGVVADVECLHPDTGSLDRRHRRRGQSGDRVVGFLDGQPHVGQPGEDVQKCEVAQDGRIGRVFRSGTKNAQCAIQVAGARHCESRSDVCGAGRFVAVVVIQLDRFHSEADRVVEPAGGGGAVARHGEKERQIPVLGLPGEFEHLLGPSERFGPHMVPGVLVGERGEPHRLVDEVGVGSPPERGCEVGDLSVDVPVREHLVRADVDLQQAFDLIGEVGGVDVASRVTVTTNGEKFLGELSDRLEQPIAHLIARPIDV